MTAAERADAYLTIPASYGPSLGGARWSDGYDAIELPDGTTRALAEELRAVLEGVFARPPVPPFAFVLMLFDALKHGPNGVAFAAARGAVARFRNAGLLIAELCRGLPTAAAPPGWEDVALAVDRRRLLGVYRLASEEEPPLSPPEFEERIAAALGRLTDVDLAHWLTHGCAPSDAGAKLAEPVESLPARVARLLALARRRPRLAGAAALAAATDSALTLPARRRSPDAVPQGGYCDVTTRGDPDRLLPSQFALDPDEFVRRFAGRELLYFRREEPHAAERPERVVVLDQGVRTWGGVRLALAAAALTLLKTGAARAGRVRLVATSAADPVDVLGADIGAVADRLEASDLGTHPAAALRRALLDPAAGDGPRDVILLTHPRNLGEADVIAAARDRRRGDRLFAVSVDETGRAELTEWTAGGPVGVRSFRVDLAAAEAARAEGERARPRAAGPGTAWAGDVEPVGFPFRPGLAAVPALFGFDAAGEWLVMAGRDGLSLQGLGLDGAPPEVLPRPFYQGAVLKQVEAILGVLGGVVVCGRMRPVVSGAVTVTASAGAPVLAASATPPGPPELFVAAHYDRAAGRVTVHALGPATTVSRRWSAYPDLHCVSVHTPHTVRGPKECVVDLAAPGRPGAGRAGLAWELMWRGGAPPYPLAVYTRSSPTRQPDNGFSLFLAGNTLRVHGPDPAWEPFEPTRDGQPLLAGTTINQAVLAGDVLALSLFRPGVRKLVLFRGPGGAVLGEMTYLAKNLAFALSMNGRLLARNRGAREVVVSDTARPAEPIAVATLAGLHDNLKIRLTEVPFRLTIRVGRFAHTFHFRGDELQHTPVEPEVALTGGPYSPSAAAPQYDPTRFPPDRVVSSGRLRAVLDRLGQVLLYEGDSNLVAAFLVHRKRAAAWLPNGVFWGDSALIGGPPTPQAARWIGRAILAAGGVP